MKNKQLLINLFLVLGYFTFLLVNGYGQSGGDIFIIIMMIIAVSTHLLSLLIYKLIVKKKILKGFYGVCIGVIISAVIFQIANYVVTH